MTDIDIRSQSSAANGTRFSLTLTAATTQAGQAPVKPAIDLNYQGNRQLIAVLDDQPWVRASVEALLKAWQFDTVSAASAGELLGALSRHDKHPELIIADYQLQRETGGAAIAQIHDYFDEAIPALIITSNTSSDTWSLAATSGHRVLQKPIEPEAMIEAVSQILGNAQDRQTQPA